MRTFETAWFSKAATKAGISHDDLCKVIRQVMNEQADDLGGGVFKKRQLAKSYEKLTDGQFALLARDGALNEICHEDTKIQEQRF